MYKIDDEKNNGLWSIVQFIAVITLVAIVLLIGASIIFT